MISISFKIILILIFLNISLNNCLNWFDCSDNKSILLINNITLINNNSDNKINLQINGYLNKEINNGGTIQIDSYNLLKNQVHFKNEILNFCNVFNNCPYKIGLFLELISIDSNFFSNKNNLIYTNFLAINEIEFKNNNQPIFCFTFF